METDKSKVVSIMSFNSVMEAQLYKALLESAGVTARLQNDIATQVYPPIGIILPVNILVAEEDQVRAREILGAKFDIDEFQRQSDPKLQKQAAKKTASKKSATKKTAAKKSSASRTSSAKRTVKKPEPVMADTCEMSAEAETKK